MPTALLICLEDTFWYTGISVKGQWGLGDNNFPGFFEKSFTFYDKSGMREKVEAEIDILTNEQGGSPVDSDFVEKFCKTIFENLIRKIYCLYVQSTLLTTFFAKIQPAPGSQEIRFKILRWNELEESLLGKLAAKIGTRILYGAEIECTTRNLNVKV